jgi:SH3-like domain-containing protein
MRASLAIIAFGFAVSTAVAEPTKRTAFVDIDGVEIRAGHALNFPAVGQLRKGDSVIVVREEETGFYAIQPPTGSVSWIKLIHLAKVEMPEGGKANVPVAVEGAEVMAGIEKSGKPTNRVTTRLPKGTIVEVVGPVLREENTNWFPITPPEGDLRWIPKSALRSGSITALAPPSPYVRPDGSPFSVTKNGDAPPKAAPGTGAAKLPVALTEHRLWTQASQAEKSGEFTTARSLYARIYQDLWDSKAERDAIVICYNRYTRCDDAIKKGDSPRTENRTNTGTPTSRSSPVGAKWSSAGYLKELQKVYVDGQQVFSFQDDRGNVMYYVTSVAGINLKNFDGKRVQVYGPTESRPELYRPHISAERVELAK